MGEQRSSQACDTSAGHGGAGTAVTRSALEIRFRV